MLMFMTNSEEHSPREIIGEEKIWLLWKPKGHYCVFKSPMIAHKTALHYNVFENSVYSQIRSWLLVG